MKSFFRTLNPKVHFLLSVFLAVCAVSILFWFSFFFVLDRVRHESAEIEAAKIRRASLEIRRSEAKREEAALAELQADVERVEEMFVERPLAFFEFLEDLASHNNLSILLALEGEEGVLGKPERLHVTVEGTYRNLSRFIQGLESAPYTIEIRAVVLEMLTQRPIFFDSFARLVINLQIISK
ncbi:MAG: hypothetical protein Q7R73_01970 [bacterium]|nr:hypothetical protein [bacterium]